MCEVCDHRGRTTRTNTILIVVMFVLIGVMAVLIARFNSLLNNAYDLQQQNHVVACHIDKEVSDGIRILQCQDVPDSDFKKNGGK